MGEAIINLAVPFAVACVIALATFAYIRHKFPDA